MGDAGINVDKTKYIYIKNIYKTNCDVICQAFTLRPVIKRVIKIKTPVQKSEFKKPILNRRFLIIGPSPVSVVEISSSSAFVNLNQ